MERAGNKSDSMKMYCNDIRAKLALHSEIFIRAIHLQCLNAENTPFPI